MYCKEYHKEYRERRKEYFREYHKNYRLKNKGSVSLQQSLWYEKNKERILKEREKYYLNNKLLIKERRNPLVYRKSNKKRLVLTKGLKKENIQLVYENNIKENDTLTCHYCKKQIEFGNDSIDHKIPLSRGGGNEISNLVIACKRCNNKKHTKTEVEYFF